MLSKYLKLSALSLASAALVACGGGGGGSDTGTPGDDTTLPGGGTGTGTGGDGGAVVTPSPIQTTVPTATYSAGSGAATAYALLNAERQRCGFGLLAQNAKLDQAAADAQNYWTLRLQESDAAGSAYQHDQDASATGFTGVTPQDRAAYRGYEGGVGESLGREWGTGAPLSETTEQIAKRQTRNLLGSVYHMGALMTGYTEVGVSYAGEVLSAGGNYYYGVTFGLGVPTGTGAQDSSDLRTYPCEGSAAVNHSFRPSQEWPNPAPDLGSAWTGPPILLQAGIGKTLVVTSYSISLASGGSPIASRLITVENDVHGAVSANTAFILPLSTLSYFNEPYRVEVAVTIDGVPATRSFTFTPVDAAW